MLSTKLISRKHSIEKKGHPRGQHDTSLIFWNGGGKGSSIILKKKNPSTATKSQNNGLIYKKKKKSLCQGISVTNQ